MNNLEIAEKDISFFILEIGIYVAEKYYNTNKITLADWLTKESTSTS